MQQTRKKRKAKIVLEPKTMERLLRHRIKGYSLGAIAGIFKLNSRQEVSKLIKDNKNEPGFARLYEEIEKTLVFLNRKI